MARASQTEARPADTAMMGVVHSALRRDLVRARIVATSKQVALPRRIALGKHLLWMMDVLHHHHESEDDGLYPLVVRNNPEAATLVAIMDAEHGAVGTVIAAVQAAAVDYRDQTTGSRERLLSALKTMDEVLVPHLAREETEMMPLVSSSISDEEWMSWDISTNVKSKSPIQLGMEGHWLLDGADEKARTKLLGQVPAVPRFVVLHGFRPAYARKTRALWAGTVAADVPALTLDNYDTWARSNFLD